MGGGGGGEDLIIMTNKELMCPWGNSAAFSLALIKIIALQIIRLNFNTF